MTIEQKIQSMLEENGMSPSQAQAVIQKSKETNDPPDMRNRWQDEMEVYPVQLIDVLWMCIRRIALEWIDANVPQAWYRDVFVNE